MAENARPVSPDYAAGLRFAADVAHSEARWQTELSWRVSGGGPHTYAAERASELEAAIRAVADAVMPTTPAPTNPLEDAAAAAGTE